MRTIARFQYPEYAWLFQSYLRDQEIDAHVFDEHVVQWQWTLSDAIGGVRVVVPWRDAEAAAELWSGYHDRINRAPSPLSIARGGWAGLLIIYYLFGIFLIFGRRSLLQPRDQQGDDPISTKPEKTPVSDR